MALSSSHPVTTVSGGIMKRNVEKTRQLLNSLAALSIDFDKVLQTLDTFPSILEWEEGDDVTKFLTRIGRIKEGLLKLRPEIEEGRFEGEATVWNRQTDSPNLKHPVGDLEISGLTAECIPVGVETIGDLCRYRSSELLTTDSRLIYELRDVLSRSYALVLYPHKG